MAIEKGQKYRGKYTGNVYEVLSDPFVNHEGESMVVVRDDRDTVFEPVDSLESGTYTLIREPKFKVGDRVTYPHGGEVYEIVAVSPDADPDGDFGHLVKSKLGWFCLIHNPKAAG